MLDQGAITNAISLDDARKSYLLNLTIIDSSPKTHEWYDYIFVFFTRWCAKRGITTADRITTEELRHFFYHLEFEHYNKQTKKVGLSKSTRSDFYCALRALFNYLVREGWLGESPLEGIKKIKRPKEKITPFTPEQFEAMLAQCRTKEWPGLRNFTLMHLIYDTGLRINEALSITERDIFMEQKRIVVVGKGGKERSVWFGYTTLKHLNKYLIKLKQRHRQTDRIFVNQDGTPLQDRRFSKAMERYAERAGITGVRPSPHTLRHTFAVQYLMRGGDVRSLADILGHESITTTDIYVSFTKDNVQKQHSRFSPGDALGRNGNGR